MICVRSMWRMIAHKGLIFKPQRARIVKMDQIVLKLARMNAHQSLTNQLAAILDRDQMSVRSAANQANIPARSLQNVLDGKVPSINRAEEICRALGLELHIGPARPEFAALPAAQTARIRTTEIERSTQSLVRAVAEAGGNPFPPGLQDEAVMTLAAANADVAPLGARPIDVVEYAAAAGGGAENDSKEVLGLGWFTRAWFDSNGLDPRQCAIIRVHGESMEPTLPNGCAILFDRSRRTLQQQRIYVIRTDDGLVVKRVLRDGAAWLLMSDHPAWRPGPWPQDAEALGEVLWTARTLRDPAASPHGEEAEDLDPTPGGAYWEAIAPSPFSRAVPIVGRMRRNSYGLLAAITDIDAAAGTDTPSRDEVPSGKGWLSRAWFELYRIDADSCAVTLVRDDSMAPAFPSGSEIMFCRRFDEPEKDGVYVVRMPDGGLTLRRALEADTGWKLAADNRGKGSATPWPPDGILGRVVWSATTHIKVPLRELGNAG